MDRDTLKRVIIEEVLRALSEMGAEGANRAHTLATAPYAVPARWRFERPQAAPEKSPSPIATGPGFGLAVFSGAIAPSDSLLDALAALVGSGAELLGLPSLTFRLTRLYGSADPLRGLPLFGAPDDEAALERTLERARFVLAPNPSANTLAKLAAGIEDSVPTRALAGALRLGKPLIIVEEPPSRAGLAADNGAAPSAAKSAAPVAANPRADRIRALASRGAFVTEPGRLPQDVFEALWPTRERPYEPPAPKPVPMRPIVTKEDVYEVFRMGAPELVVPADAIVTGEALEDAARRALIIRRLDP